MTKENEEFTIFQTKRNCMLDKATLGFIEFLPKEGIASAKNGEWWLQNTDKLIGKEIGIYSDDEIEKILSSRIDSFAQKGLREDPLEGHLLKKHIKASTNFMSCFTKVTVDDIDSVTLKLNDGFIENIKLSGMDKGDKGFVFISNMPKFVNILKSKLNQMVFIKHTTNSSLYFREVRYLNGKHYKKEANKLEMKLEKKDIQLDAGLTESQAKESNIYNEYLEGLKFAITTKLLDYSIQAEARLSINFSDSLKQDFIKIKCNSFSNTMSIFNDFYDLENLRFENLI